MYIKNKWNFYKNILKEEWLFILYKLMHLLLILKIGGEIKIFLIMYYCMDLYDSISNRKEIFNKRIQLTFRDIVINLKENEVDSLKDKIGELENNEV